MRVSKGCSDPTLPHITSQMQVKLSKRKEAIPLPTDKQYDSPRATIVFDELRKSLSSLKSRVDPDLIGLRNEHLTALIFNDRLNVTLKAKQAFSSLHNRSIEIAGGELTLALLCDMNSW